MKDWILYVCDRKYYLEISTQFRCIHIQHIYHDYLQMRETWLFSVCFCKGPEFASHLDTVFQFASRETSLPLSIVGDVNLHIFQWWIRGKGGLLNWSIFIILKIQFKWVCLLWKKVHVYKVFAVDEWTLMLCRVYLWRHGRPHQFTPISKKLPLPTRLRRCHNLYTACWKYCSYVSMYPINCISIINQTQRLTIIRTIECSYKLGLLPSVPNTSSKYH